MTPPRSSQQDDGAHQAGLPSVTKRGALGTFLTAATASLLAEASSAPTAHASISARSGMIDVRAMGAVGDGIADDTRPIQAALDTGQAVHLPNGIYKITSPLQTATVGQVILGDSAQNTYLVIGGAHDGLRVAHSHCEIRHILFRPSQYSVGSVPTFAPIRIFSAFSYIHNNRFLAAAPGRGVALLLDDIDPSNKTPISGAYTHTISNNYIATDGYNFQFGIYALCKNNGLQATKFLNNYIFGDAGILITRGGGNFYSGNLFQSATGTEKQGIGRAIDLQKDVFGETIVGNYIERYETAVHSENTDKNVTVATVFGNHWDNNSQIISENNTHLLIILDETKKRYRLFGWNHEFDDTRFLRFISPKGKEIYQIDSETGSFEPSIISLREETLQFNSDGEKKTPSFSYCQITGNGSHRRQCELGNGERSGQHLYLTGLTWSVQIVSGSSIQYHRSETAATFGNRPGDVALMHLIWNATFHKWIEVSRTLV